MLSPAASEASITQGLRDRMGDGVRINLRLVEHIPAEASGKHRYVVSHVPLHGALRAAGSEFRV